MNRLPALAAVAERSFDYFNETDCHRRQRVAPAAQPPQPRRDPARSGPPLPLCPPAAARVTQSQQRLQDHAAIARRLGHAPPLTLAAFKLACLRRCIRTTSAAAAAAASSSNAAPRVMASSSISCQTAHEHPSETCKWRLLADLQLSVGAVEGEADAGAGRVRCDSAQLLALLDGRDHSRIAAGMAGQDEGAKA